MSYHPRSTLTKLKVLTELNERQYEASVRVAKGNRGSLEAGDELSEANRGDHDRGRRARRNQLIKPSKLGFVAIIKSLR
jgi:hypothetical protein